VTALVEERSRRLASVEAVELSLRQLRKQLSECQEARVSRRYAPLRINSGWRGVREHVTHRYQTELEAFRPEWDLFRATVREQRKRLDQSISAIPVTEEITASADRPDLIPEVEWEWW